MSEVLGDNCQNVLDDIYNRSGGDFDRMTYSDKVLMVSIMREYKKIVDQFLEEEYPKLKMWASLDEKDIQLQETEPDWNVFREDYNNNRLGVF